jgi:hypothetical protein
MYLSTGDIIAVIISLLCTLTLVGFAIKDNIRLNSENAWLRNRNRELKKQLNNSAPLPWTSSKPKKDWVK